ncbi:response regulator transcription factor [Natronosalvus vescus]|uniref:response regulator transcription factor n=1 Tax=Natronosalvus vescus TaxID=2953881 RepID=UPI0020901210|nr:response regulator [Natronosalvus vescus]
MSTQPTILVVDDETELTDLYATWVGDSYDVLTAYDGRSALEQLTDEVDIVLLDRHMPDLTGDEVLEEIRRRGHDCWVIMVTAVDPGLDIVALDIDDYVTKPVTRSQLTRIIDTLRVQSRYLQDGRRELQALSNKKDTLEDELTMEELEGTETYQQLEDELGKLGESLGDGFEEA